MADIRKYPGLRHLRAGPTTHVRHLRAGRAIHEGSGLSFWYRPLAAVISEIPVDDRELPLLVHARTADFQDVTVQATVTFHVTDPAVASGRIDFSIDPDNGVWRGTPLEQVGTMIIESAQQHILALIASLALTEVLTSGASVIRNRVADGLHASPRLDETGIAVVDVRIVAVRPDADVERALETPARERIQQQSDAATFERRAVAVERERVINENELQTQIELAKREERLVAQRGTNGRRQAEETAAASQIETESQAQRETRIGAVRADATRSMGEAMAAGEAARMAAYRDVSEATLLGLALKELAANLPKVQSLVLTPDLIQPLLARFGGTSPAAPAPAAAIPVRPQAPKR